MNEVFAVAAFWQVALPASIVADTMAVLDTVAADGTTSMQRDIRDGKPSELEYWNGAVIRLAREKGIPVPTHEFYLSLAASPGTTSARGSRLGTLSADRPC